MDLKLLDLSLLDLSLLDFSFLDLSLGSQIFVRHPYGSQVLKSWPFESQPLLSRFFGSLLIQPKPRVPSVQLLELLPQGWFLLTHWHLNSCTSFLEWFSSGSTCSCFHHSESSHCHQPQAKLPKTFLLSFWAGSIGHPIRWPTPCSAAPEGAPALREQSRLFRCVLG